MSNKLTKWCAKCDNHAWTELFKAIDIFAFICFLLVHDGQCVDLDLSHPLLKNRKPHWNLSLSSCGDIFTDINEQNYLKKCTVLYLRVLKLMQVVFKVTFNKLQWKKKEEVRKKTAAIVFFFFFLDFKHIHVNWDLREKCCQVIIGPTAAVLSDTYRLIGLPVLPQELNAPSSDFSMEALAMQHLIGGQRSTEIKKTHKNKLMPHGPRSKNKWHKILSVDILKLESKSTQTRQ